MDENESKSNQARPICFSRILFEFSKQKFTTGIWEDTGFWKLPNLDTLYEIPWFWKTPPHYPNLAFNDLKIDKMFKIPVKSTKSVTCMACMCHACSFKAFLLDVWNPPFPCPDQDAEKPEAAEPGTGRFQLHLQAFLRMYQDISSQNICNMLQDPYETPSWNHCRPSPVCQSMLHHWPDMETSKGYPTPDT